MVIFTLSRKAFSTGLAIRPGWAAWRKEISMNQDLRDMTFLLLTRKYCSLEGLLYKPGFESSRLHRKVPHAYDARDL
jgi:hypothetical protein